MGNDILRSRTSSGRGKFLIFFYVHRKLELAKNKLNFFVLIHDRYRLYFLCHALFSSSKNSGLTPKVDWIHEYSKLHGSYKHYRYTTSS